MSAPLVIPGEIAEDGVIRLDLPRTSVQALCKARFAGQRIDCEFRPRKSKRTAQANAAFHAGLFEWAAHKQLAGEPARVWVEDMKDDLLGLCWGYVVRQNQLTGEITKRLVEPHTSRLTVAQFTELFDVALVEAAKDGHVWRLPGRHRQRRDGGSRGLGAYTGREA